MDFDCAKLFAFRKSACIKKRQIHINLTQSASWPVKNKSQLETHGLVYLVWYIPGKISMMGPARFSGTSGWGIGKGLINKYLPELHLDGKGLFLVH